MIVVIVKVAVKMTVMFNRWESKVAFDAGRNSHIYVKCLLFAPLNDVLSTLFILPGSDKALERAWR